ncbi:MAG: helix-hairpin-helix domain-containing protein, partial [Chloroflexi bacterium]|nr:helix-hairpin-helix domain-containing protein [Chloroflexota bacterium]
LRRPEPKPLTIMTPTPRPSATPATLIVQVGGAVLNPGVVRLSEGARVDDALKAAGGAIGNADLSRLNLARHVNDGELIYVPQVGEPTPTVAAGGVRASPTPTGDKININTASADELDRLPGIGPALAQRMIEYRQANGPFERIEDVMKVRGIGPSQFESIKNLIVVR